MGDGLAQRGALARVTPAELDRLAQAQGGQDVDAGHTGVQGLRDLFPVSHGNLGREQGSPGARGDGGESSGLTALAPPVQKLVGGPGAPLQALANCSDRVECVGKGKGEGTGSGIEMQAC